MDLNSIRNALHEQPFKPFELCLADGRRVPVLHPEFVAMNQRIVIVMACSPKTGPCGMRVSSAQEGKEILDETDATQRGADRQEAA